MANEGIPHDAGVEAARARVELNREIVRDEKIDAGLAEAALRSELEPADFEQGRRVLNSYLAGLDPDERARIENATTRDGGRALHDPTTLRALAKQALGPMPRTREAAQTELAAARKRMANDKTWHMDDRAQLRYRMLLRATNG